MRIVTNCPAFGTSATMASELTAPTIGPSLSPTQNTMAINEDQIIQIRIHHDTTPERSDPIPIDRPALWTVLAGCGRPIQHLALATIESGYLVARAPVLPGYAVAIHGNPARAE